MKIEPETHSPTSILNDEFQLTLNDLCRACRVPAEHIFMLVEEGILEPRGREPARWLFQGISVIRVHRVYRLKHDLGVNTAGAALALQLMDEIEQLRSRLRQLDGQED